MPATEDPAGGRRSHTVKTVDKDSSERDESPQGASFLLEVRNRQVTHELAARINLIMAESGFDVTVTPTQLVPGSVSLPHHGISSAPARAELLGEARLVSWTQDGMLVEVSKVEAAWGVKRQAVDAARQRGEIFSVWVRGKHWYPGDVLKLERAALAAINRALGDVDPSSKLLFLMRKHGALGGQTAADAVAQGKFDDVLRLASDWART